MIKLLHIGLMVDGKNKGLSKALRELTDYREVALSDPDLVAKACSEDFDVCFMQVQSETVQDKPTEELLAPVKEKGMVINWTGDIRNHTPHWMVRFNADITAFSNQLDRDWETKVLL